MSVYEHDVNDSYVFDRAVRPEVGDAQAQHAHAHPQRRSSFSSFML